MESADELSTSHFLSYLKRLQFFQWDYFRLIIVLGSISILVLLLSLDLIPNAIGKLEVGKPSPITIKSPRTVAVVDAAKTEQLRQQAAKKVSTYYKWDKSSNLKSKDKVSKLFQQLKLVIGNQSLSDSDKLEKLSSLLSGIVSRTDQQELLKVPLEKLSEVEKSSLALLNQASASKIKTSSLDQAKAGILAKTVDLTLETDTERRLAARVAAHYLRPNYFVDRKKTNEEIDKAVSKIKPVMINKLRGQVIVREGEIVNQQENLILKELGLLHSASSTSLAKIIGLILGVAFLLAIFLLYLHEFQRKTYDSHRLLLMLTVIIVVIVAIAKSTSPYLPSYVAPVAAAAMLASVLLNVQIGVMVAIISSLLLSLGIQDPQFLFLSLLSGLVGAYFTGSVTCRSDLTRAGIWLMAAMGLLGGILSLISGLPILEVVINVGWGIIGGFFAAMLTIGGAQLLEYLFNVTTDMKLLELANPAQELLKQLMMKAPGTYNHSIAVSNIAESAADKVGANPLLVRVGAYYHDIGKIKRPGFFIENQRGVNPHDRTKPNLSTLVITAHVKEGVELAKRHHLPREVVDIIKQHHGNSLITYFYDRAKKTQEKQKVDENEFRYSEDKPKSRAAALIMLADSAEAAVRSVSKPTVSKINQSVKKIIKDKLEDGQLDECDLTLGDLDSITQAFTEALVNMHHSRIEYPTCELAGGKKKGILTGALFKQSVKHSNKLA